MGVLESFLGPVHRVLHSKRYFTYFTFRGEVPRVGDFLSSPDGERLKVEEVTWHRYKDSERLVAWVHVEGA